MKKKHLVFVILIAFVIAWSVTLAIIKPETIVEAIGVENGYIAAFIIAALGGVSTITASSYFLTIVTLAGGGANPYLLGIIAGTGITVGDSLFYYLGFRGRDIANEKIYAWIKKFSRWLDKRPGWLVSIIVFIYTAFTPLPNDFLTVSLGISSYPYKNIIIPLWAGNITITIIFGLGASFGFNLL